MSYNYIYERNLIRQIEGAFSRLTNRKPNINFSKLTVLELREIQTLLLDVENQVYMAKNKGRRGLTYF